MSAELGGTSVVVENDVTALAIRRAYTKQARDFALVAVYPEGVGAGFVIDGRPLRGAHGGAGEIGHVRVDSELRKNGRGFGRACACGEYGHLDTLATPARILEEVGATDLRMLAMSPKFKGDRVTKEAQAFRVAGAALGQSLVMLRTLNDPARLILMLPRELARPTPGTAASLYLDSVETELASGVGVMRPAELDVHAFDDPHGVYASTSAAACVLHAFVEHARGRNRCAVVR